MSAKATLAGPTLESRPARLCGTFRFSGLASAASFPSASGGSGTARAAAASGARAGFPAGRARAAGAPRSRGAPRSTGPWLGWRSPARLRCREVVLPAGDPGVSATSSLVPLRQGL